MFCTFAFFLSAEGAASALFVDSFSFFFCRRFSACESKGSSSASEPASESESDWEPSESFSLLEASLSDSSESRCLLRGCGDVATDCSESLALLEDEEEAMIEAKWAEAEQIQAPECTTFSSPRFTACARQRPMVLSVQLPLLAVRDLRLTSMCYLSLLRLVTPL